MPKIVITEPAEADLEDIFQHYAPILGEPAAHDVVLKILEQLELLETFPGMGRPSLKPDVRELVINRYPFLAPYRIENAEVQVLRVLHQRALNPKNW